MEALLGLFLEQLDQFGTQHSELYDTMVREAMGEALYVALVFRREGYVLPTSYGLFNDEANVALGLILQDFVDKALLQFDEDGLTQEQERKAAIWNRDVMTASGKTPDGFLGAF